MSGPFDYPLPPTATGYGRAGMKPRFMGPPVRVGGGSPPFRPPGFDPHGGYTGSGGPLPPSPVNPPPAVLSPGNATGGGAPVAPWNATPDPMHQPAVSSASPGWVDAGYGTGPLNDQGLQWGGPGTPPVDPLRQRKTLGQAGLYGVSR